MNLYKEIRKNHTVEFVVDEQYHFGVISDINIDEETYVYTIVSHNKIYKNVKQQYILHNYGVLNND